VGAFDAPTVNGVLLEAEPDGVVTASVPDEAPLGTVATSWLGVELLTDADLTRITSPNGRWIEMTYDTSHRVTQAKDNGGRTVGHTYDTSGRLWKVTDRRTASRSTPTTRPTGCSPSRTRAASST
jgi:YD repeat-containing protein